ncbi:MAG: glycine radical domain-containing protein, partial [Eubacterium sp.]
QAFGVADNADSMYAIEKNVFLDKKITLEELQDALKNNFGEPLGATGEPGCVSTAGDKSAMEQKVYDVVRQVLAASGSVDLNTLDLGGAAAPTCAGNTSRYAQIRQLLMNSPHFGNDEDCVDMMGKRCASIYSDEVEKYTNPRGGQFQAGCYPVSANVLFGKDVGALPDGRLAKQPLADGVSPRQGMDTDGPTAAACSVAKLDHEKFSNGTLYNQKFLPTAVAGDEGIKNFAAVVRTYFQRKGMHVQFNVIDKDTLIDAQKHPENYKDLVVRVAGYSAQWTVLAKEVQDDIISRTEQEF